MKRLPQQTHRRMAQSSRKVLFCLGITTLLVAAMLTTGDNSAQAIDHLDQPSKHMSNNTPIPITITDEIIQPNVKKLGINLGHICLLYTSPSPRDS